MTSSQVLPLNEEVQLMHGKLYAVTISGCSAAAVSDLTMEEKEKYPDANLNVTQKQAIRSVFYFIFDAIRELEPEDAIQALIASTAPTVSQSQMVFFTEKGIWSDIRSIRDIFSHKCPQNRAIGSYEALAMAEPKISALSPNEISGDIAEGIYNGLVYFLVIKKQFDKKEKRAREVKTPDSETQGILSLTRFNDDTAGPITKEATINYIQDMINQVIMEQEELLKKKLFKKNKNNEGVEEEQPRCWLDPDMCISKDQWLLCIARKGDKNIIFLNGVCGAQSIFLARYEDNKPFMGMGHAWVSAKHVSEEEFRKEESNLDCLELYEIDRIQGRTLINSIRSDVESYQERNKINICSSIGFFSSCSSCWAAEKLKDIHIDIDVSPESKSPKKTGSPKKMRSPKKARNPEKSSEEKEKRMRGRCLIM